MAKKELIEVKEFPKGIENITAINWAHEDLKSFVVDLVSIYSVSLLCQQYLSISAWWCGHGRRVALYNIASLYFY